MSAKEDKTAKMLPLLIELANLPPQDMIPQGWLLAKREEEGREGAEGRQQWPGKVSENAICRRHPCHPGTLFMLPLSTALTEGD